MKEEEKWGVEQEGGHGCGTQGLNHEPVVNRDDNSARHPRVGLWEGAAVWGGSGSRVFCGERGKICESLNL